MEKLELIKDDNGNPVPIVNLTASHDVDGTGASAQSNIILGRAVRILSLDNILRIEIGTNPTALTTSLALAALSEIYLPIKAGNKVAILGGKANISTVSII
jgi:hypothetical protein